MNDSAVKLRVLGDPVAEIGGRTFGPDATHVFAALVVLVLQPQHRITRQRLGTLLWSDAPSSRRGERLRWLLSKMRGLGVPIDVGTVEVRLLPPVIDVDYVTLLGGFDRATQDRLPRLDAIDAVFRDYAPDFSPAFQRWIEDQREAIGDELLTRLVPLLGDMRQGGNWQATERVARAIRRVSPLHEEATLALAEALCGAGDKAHGIKVLDDFLSEVGDSPMRLPAELLRRRVSVTSDSVTGGTAQPVPFVGRREQLRRFQSMLADAAAGRGAALLFCGPAGIGKSRLLEETASFAASIGRASVVRARCQPGDALRPLSGLTDVIPRLLELRGAAGCDPRALELLTRLGEIEERHGGELASLPPGRELSSVRRDQMRDAVIDLFAAISQEQMLVVQIDDFQWSDAALRWLWESVLSNTRDQRILWCFGARLEEPRDADALFSRDAQSLLRIEWLPALERAEAASFVDTLLSGGQGAPSPAVRDAIVERGGGIPLVLLELVRSWHSGGDTEVVPATLAALMHARLTHLSGTARRTLQVSALLGSFSKLNRLERVLQLPRAEFLDALAQLENAGILTTDRAGVTHGHVLWAEAALARLEPSVANVLHRHVAEQFDQEMAASPSADFLWESARHWEAGGQMDRALSAIVRGAEHLVHNGLYAEAAAAYGRAMTRSADAVDQLRFIRRRIALFNFIGHLPSLVGSIKQHEELSLALDPLYDRHNEFEILALHQRSISGEPLDAVAVTVLSCAREETATTSHRMHASYNCVIWGMESDRGDIAEEGFRILMSLTPATFDDRRHRALGEMIYHARFGDASVAIPVGQEWIAVERQHGTSERLCHSYRMLGLAGMFAGKIDLVRQSFAEAIRIARAERLGKILTLSYDLMLATSSDYDEPNVFREWVDRAGEDCEPLSAHYSPVVQILRNNRAQLAIEEGDGHAALRYLSLDIESVLPERAVRARITAMSLGALQLIACSPEQEIEKHRLAAELGACLQEPARWIGWPAAIYAEYLDAYEGSEAADAFVERFCRDVLRERIPPRRLEPFVRRISGARAEVRLGA